MDSQRKLRLILFEECHRNCPGCCNHDWDIPSLPICDDYSPYDIVLLTGGEPMLRPDIVHDTVRTIRKTSQAEIYLYTAKVDDFMAARSCLAALDGMCVTLHDEGDILPWLRFASIVSDLAVARSMRLNVFRGIGLPSTAAHWIERGWMVKKDMNWIRNCPLPDGETLMRLLPEQTEAQSYGGIEAEVESGKTKEKDTLVEQTEYQGPGWDGQLGSLSQIYHQYRRGGPD